MPLTSFIKIIMTVDLTIVFCTFLFALPSIAIGSLNIDNDCYSDTPVLIFTYGTWLVVNGVFGMFLAFVMVLNGMTESILMGPLRVILFLFSCAWGVVGLTSFLFDVPTADCSSEVVWRYGYALLILSIVAAAFAGVKSKWDE